MSKLLLEYYQSNFAIAPSTEDPKILSFSEWIHTSGILQAITAEEFQHPENRRLRAIIFDFAYLRDIAELMDKKIFIVNFAIQKEFCHAAFTRQVFVSAEINLIENGLLLHVASIPFLTSDAGIKFLGNCCARMSSENQSERHRAEMLFNTCPFPPTEVISALLGQFCSWGLRDPAIPHPIFVKLFDSVKEISPDIANDMVSGALQTQKFNLLTYLLRSPWKELFRAGLELNADIFNPTIEAQTRKYQTGITLAHSQLPPMIDCGMARNRLNSLKESQ